jgi:hypothetical protein
MSFNISMTPPRPKYCNPGPLWHWTADAASLLRAGWDQKRSQGSLYGRGLAVSADPMAWRQIARLGGSDLVRVILPPVAKILDLRATFGSVDPNELPPVIHWAVQNGLAQPAKAYRLDFVSTNDNDEDVEQYQICDTRAEAEEEAKAYDQSEIKEIDSLNYGKKRDWGADQDLLRAYVAANYPQAAVAWYDDILDVASLSAPQGYVLPGWESKVKFKLKNTRQASTQPAALIDDAVLAQEQAALLSDKEKYLECMNGFLLKDRKTPQEIRDGLILFWNVYRVIRPNPEERPKVRKNTRQASMGDNPAGKQQEIAKLPVEPWSGYLFHATPLEGAISIVKYGFHAQHHAELNEGFLSLSQNDNIFRFFCDGEPTTGFCFDVNFQKVMRIDDFHLALAAWESGAGWWEELIEKDPQAQEKAKALGYGNRWGYLGMDERELASIIPQDVEGVILPGFDMSHPNAEAEMAVTQQGCSKLMSMVEYVYIRGKEFEAQEGLNKLRKIGKLAEKMTLDEACQAVLNLQPNKPEPLEKVAAANRWAYEYVNYDREQRGLADFEDTIVISYNPLDPSRDIKQEAWDQLMRKHRFERGWKLRRSYRV